MTIEQAALNHQIVCQLNEKIAAKLGTDQILDPWTKSITPLQRAKTHLDLLASTYGGGHPGSQEPLDSLIKRQQSGAMLTWIITWQDHPVGMANLEIQDGVAELVRAVEIPTPRELKPGLVYNGEASVSTTMYQAIADLLSRQKFLDRLWAVEADLRLARSITLPNGKTLKSGEATQHINYIYGLTPYLLAVPRYQVHPVNGQPHQEMFLQSRLYLQPKRINYNQPIYAPVSSPGKAGIPEIANTTFSIAQYPLPKIITNSESQLFNNHLDLTNPAGIHFSVLHLNGRLDSHTVKSAILTGLDNSRFVEIILPNAPENISLQQSLLDLGAVPLGIFPGGEFYNQTKSNFIQTVPTTIHYGVIRPETANQLVDISTAQDYSHTPLPQICENLKNQWNQQPNSRLFKN